MDLRSLVGARLSMTVFGNLIPVSICFLTMFINFFLLFATYYSTKFAKNPFPIILKVVICCVYWTLGTIIFFLQKTTHLKVVILKMTRDCSAALQGIDRYHSQTQSWTFRKIRQSTWGISLSGHTLTQRGSTGTPENLEKTNTRVFTFHRFLFSVFS